MSLFLSLWIHIQTCIWFTVTKHNGLIKNHIPPGGEFIHVIDATPPFDRVIGYCANKRIGYARSIAWYLQLTNDQYDIEDPQLPEHQFGYSPDICTKEGHKYYEISYSPWYPPISWIDYKDGYDEGLWDFNKDWLSQYNFFLYYGVLFMCLNDIGPVDS